MLLFLILHEMYLLRNLQILIENFRIQSLNPEYHHEAQLFLSEVIRIVVFFKQII